MAPRLVSFGRSGRVPSDRVGKVVVYLDSQSACGGIISTFWERYQTSGDPADYEIAAAAYRIGIQNSLPCEKLNIIVGCPAEWADTLRRRLD